MSRIEVLQLAVNMLKVKKSSPTEYKNTYSDIDPALQSADVIADIQTGLDQGLILKNSGTFSP